MAGASLNSLLDGMLVYHRVSPQEYVAGTHLYTWVKRDKVEYGSLSKETTRQARLEPWTSRSLVLATHAFSASDLLKQIMKSTTDKSRSV